MKYLQIACIAAALGGCGGIASNATPEPIPTQPNPSVAAPTQVLTKVDTEDACFQSQPGDSTSASAVRAAASQRNVVVSLALAEEKCTGTGGFFLLAREVDSKRVYWMGGHACYPRDKTLQQAGSLGYAVARTTTTAGLDKIRKDQCVAFLDEPDQEFSTNERLEAAANFSTLAAARAYAASLK